MRWGAKPMPQDGEIRFRSKFALLPARVGDEVVWLESFLIQEKCHWSGEGDWWQEISRHTLPRGLEQ